MSLERLLSKAAVRRFRDVEVPEIEETVRLRSLTERERSSVEQMLMTKDGKVADYGTLLRAKRLLVALSLCDENGERIVSDGEVDRLCEMDAAVLHRIYEAAAEHCGMATRTVEAAEGN